MKSLIVRGCKSCGGGAILAPVNSATYPVARVAPCPADCAPVAPRTGRTGACPGAGPEDPNHRWPRISGGFPASADRPAPPWAEARPWAVPPARPTNRWCFCKQRKNNKMSRLDSATNESIHKSRCAIRVESIYARNIGLLSWAEDNLIWNRRFLEVSKGIGTMPKSLM